MAGPAAIPQAERAGARAHRHLPRLAPWLLIALSGTAIFGVLRDSGHPGGQVLGFALAALALSLAAAMLGDARRRRHQLEAASADALAQADRLGAILMVMTEGVIITDLDRRIELISPAAEVLFGALREDAIGTDAAELLPGLFDERLKVQLTGTPSDADASLPILRETLAKRRDDDELPVRIWVRSLRLDGERRLLLLIQDLTEITAGEEQLSYLRQHDTLTGLLNRGELERRMQARLRLASKTGAPCAFCSLDVDRFKMVNDSAGHHAGDALLVQLAVLVRTKLKGASLIGRIGGDEFGALFTDCTEAQALAQCDDLLNTVRSFLFTWEERSFDISISIGLVAFVADDDSTPVAMARADIACHMAKGAGRDRLHVYRESDIDVIQHHKDIQIISTLSGALDDRRLRLHVQPIAPLADGGCGITHYEVLVRISDEHGRPIAPDRFVSAAERYILMPDVDRWIIQHLFSTRAAQLRRWHRDHPDDFLFAINLSGTSLADEGFLSYIERQFDEHGIPGASICFEITETAAIRRIGDAHTLFATLADRGCRFALDDFGSGLASFGYLRDLPVELVKIDGSFVRDISDNPVNLALVNAINQVAHILGLATIAEWAENDRTLAQLRTIGVDYAQGWAVGKPMPIESLDDLPTMPASTGRTAHRRADPSAHSA